VDRDRIARRVEAAGVASAVARAKAAAVMAIARAVSTSPAVRKAVQGIATDVEATAGPGDDGRRAILGSSGMGAARDAVADAVAEGVVDAAQKAVGKSPGRHRRMAKAFVMKALPMIPFGFIDNFIMILAGNAIEASLASTLGLSAMAAAGLGNAASDAVGAMSQDRVDSVLGRMGLGGQLEGGRAEALAGLAGGAFGVAVGALAGMFPLLLSGSVEGSMAEDVADRFLG